MKSLFVVFCFAVILFSQMVCKPCTLFPLKLKFAVYVLPISDGGYGSFAKFVDIDPQGQIVPEIWALKVKIPGFFEADMVPTPLQSFWNRQIDKMGDMGKGGFYQSVLKNIRWGQTAEQSPFINQIIQVMHKVKSNQLSIKFFLDKYDMMYTRKTFAQGRLIGTIGVSGPKSPSVSTWGRTMLSNFPKFGNRAPFVIDKSFKRLIIDFENSLPLDNNGLPLKAKYRTWYVAYSKSPLANITSSTKFHIIDSVDLADGHWFEKFAGIKWFPLTDHQISELENTPLLLLNVSVLDFFIQSGLVGWLPMLK